MCIRFTSKVCESAVWIGAVAGVSGEARHIYYCLKERMFVVFQLELLTMYTLNELLKRAFNPLWSGYARLAEQYADQLNHGSFKVGLYLVLV